MACLEAREAMISPTFSYPGYGAFFRYGVVGSGFVGCPMGVKRNGLPDGARFGRWWDWRE